MAGGERDPAARVEQAEPAARPDDPGELDQAMGWLGKVREEAGGGDLGASGSTVEFGCA
jgi:hypothetical protein